MSPTVGSAWELLKTALDGWRVNVSFSSSGAPQRLEGVYPIRPNTPTLGPPPPIRFTAIDEPVAGRRADVGVA